LYLFVVFINHSDSCRVYALAIFNALNVDDPVKLREQCMRFRRTILEPGGSKPEADMLEDFFGHKVLLEKLLEELGAENI
jgi:Zn-dependent oligopeptidase